MLANAMDVLRGFAVSMSFEARSPACVRVQVVRRQGTNSTAAGAASLLGSNLKGEAYPVFTRWFWPAGT